MKLRGTLAVVGLLALGGCSGFEPDMTGIEDTIGAELAKQVDVPISTMNVACPDSIEWRVGDEFRCMATSKGVRVQVLVHMENEEGAYSWETN